MTRVQGVPKGLELPRRQMVLERHAMPEWLW